MLNESKDFRCGWVALMGPPNAGKSTLLNALIGQKVTIVTPKPQTTRTQIVGILTDEHAQIIFMDTPGIAQLRGQLSKSMTQAVWQSLDKANINLVLLDADIYIKHPEYLEKDIEPIRSVLANDAKPLLIAPNKIDLFADKSKMLPLLTKLHEIWPNADIIPISAQKDDGLAKLKELIEAKLPVSPAQFPEDQISTASLRFMCAEIIREKLFLHLRQEVPYGVAVDVESWNEESERNLTVINAVIYVARPMYKAMIIGKDGEGIKQIGSEARVEIEELLGTRVYLELFVKVREHWQDDPAFINAINQSNQTE